MVQSLLDLREKLETCQDLALATAQQAKTKSKVWYDRQARTRSFEIGQRVLIFLPMLAKPLEAKYQGPYTIIDKLSTVDYVIATPNKHWTIRVCDINMLKEYIERDWSAIILNADIQWLAPIHANCQCSGY